MKKILLFFLMLNFMPIVSATVLEAGIAIDLVPETLFGSWRVDAKLDSTNAPRSFRAQSIDFWNLSREDDMLKLDNPYTHASAEVSIQTVEGNLVVFSKRLPYDNNKVLTDTVTLRLDGDKFSGINTLTLEYFSLIDNHLMKTETARYHITGEKIAGDSIYIDPS
jgi:hypothetical protein